MTANPALRSKSLNASADSTAPAPFELYADPGRPGTSWEVKVDGVFRGDYHKKEHALAAAALLNLTL